MSLPLSGVRVLDMSQVLAGPFTAMLLADQGAEVIKLEPLEGDSSRRLLPTFPDTNGLSLGFLSFNRNKRSIAGDFTKPSGRQLTHRLLQWADVLVINIRVGGRRRNGLTYEDVAAVNPRLIYVSVTGWGEAGPDADLPGADVPTQPRSGDIAMRRLPGGPMPNYTHIYHFDMATAMLGAYAVMLALREREHTGQGQKIELNILQTALACQAIQMTQLVGSDLRYAILPTGLPAMYRCRDDRYLYAMGGGARWESYCRSVGLGQLLEDPRFDTAEKREQQIGALTEIFSQHYSTRPATEWVAMLKKGDIGATVVQELTEVYDDPQVTANEMMVQFKQPDFGTVKAVNIPFKMSGTAGEQWLRRHAPRKGEHTFEVLQELGYGPEEVEALKGEGVIG